MLKSFLQRWWILNRLYHLSRKWDGIQWVKESHLIMWLAGVDVRNDLVNDAERGLLLKRSSGIRNWVTEYLFEIKNHEELFRELKNVIVECEDSAWIKRHSNSGHDELMLSTRGKEIYSVSYLLSRLFGNYYVKWATTFILVWALGYFLHVTIQTK